MRSSAYLRTITIAAALLIGGCLASGLSDPAMAHPTLTPFSLALFSAGIFFLTVPGLTFAAWRGYHRMKQVSSPGS